MVVVDAATAPSRGPGGEYRSVGLAQRPEMVEAEDPVEAQSFRPAGGGQNAVGLVTELGEGDAYVHAGAGRAGHPVTSSIRPEP